jgi:hypothetical protein
MGKTLCSFDVKLYRFENLQILHLRCGCAFEDAIHFILECCLYNEAREELKLKLVFLHELKIEVLLFGDDTLTEMQNLQIFKSVQLYIKRTKRFTHL